MEDPIIIGPKQDYKVFVRTITYNQAKYIKDTLDGVAMQETNFPFVHFVIDDASTDGEQEIIKAWIDCNCEMTKAEYIDVDLASVTLVPHKSNPNCNYAFYFLKRNLYKEPDLKQSLYKPWRDHCQYEALCEGDDYWIDPMKLQKQVDYMERHPDCAFCCHNSLKLDQNTGNMAYFNDYMPTHVVTFEEVIAKWFIPTQSIMLRSAFDKYIDRTQGFYNGDYNMQLGLLSYGNYAYYMNDVMGVYRIGIGISSNTSIKKNNLETIRLFRFMDERTNGKYHELFEKRINYLEHVIVRYDYMQTFCYRVKWKALLLFAQLLHFDKNKIELNLFHEVVKG